MFRVYTDDEGNTYTILQLLKKVLKEMKEFGTITCKDGEHIDESGIPSVDIKHEDGKAIFEFNYLKGSKGDKGENGSTLLYKHTIKLSGTYNDTAIERTVYAISATSTPVTSTTEFTRLIFDDINTLRADTEPITSSVQLYGSFFRSTIMIWFDEHFTSALMKIGVDGTIGTVDPLSFNLKAILLNPVIVSDTVELL